VFPKALAWRHAPPEGRSAPARASNPDGGVSEVEPIVITRRSIELLIVMAAVGNFLGTYNDLIVKIR
jgi:hypothetical protein